MGAYKRAGDVSGPAGARSKAKCPTIRMPTPSSPYLEQPVGVIFIPIVRTGPVAAQQKGRHQHDHGKSFGNAQITPLDPLACPKVIRERKGRPPEGGPKRDNHDRDEYKGDGIPQRERLDRQFDEKAKTSRRRDILHGIERLAVQRIKERCVRLLRRQ